MNDEKVIDAFKVIKQAMIDDNPSDAGSLAHSWHCNIAMMCYDAILDSNIDLMVSGNEEALKVCNDAASRFMKLCFNVETKQ